MQNGSGDSAGNSKQDIDANFTDRPIGSAIEPCQKLQEKGPNAGSKITGSNRIDIVFDPDKSKKVKKCDRIVHVQFVRRLVDGKAVKPGEVDAAFNYKDAVTVDKGWGIDFLSGETSPDYQQGSTNPDRQEGHKNGGSQTSTMWDAPNYTGLGAKFYDRATNPRGWKKAVLRFQTYAWCMEGPDCGDWYEGVGWEYTITWKDIRDGKDGASKILKKNISGPPSKKQKQAFDKFNTHLGYTPCP